MNDWHFKAYDTTPGFQELFKKMGITNYKTADMKIKEAKWENERQEFIEKGWCEVGYAELEFDNNLLDAINYRGEKLSLYIMNTNNNPKYHLFKCQTLESMHTRGRDYRYRINHHSKNNLFLMSRDNNSYEVSLDICEHCFKRIETLSYKYKNDIATKPFDLKKYFEFYDSCVPLKKSDYEKNIIIKKEKLVRNPEQQNEWAPKAQPTQKVSHRMLIKHTPATFGGNNPLELDLKKAKQIEENETTKNKYHEDKK